VSFNIQVKINQKFQHLRHEGNFLGGNKVEFSCRKDLKTVLVQYEKNNVIDKENIFSISHVHVHIQ